MAVETTMVSVTTPVVSEAAGQLGTVVGQAIIVEVRVVRMVEVVRSRGEVVVVEPPVSVLPVPVVVPTLVVSVDVVVEAVVEGVVEVVPAGGTIGPEGENGGITGLDEGVDGGDGTIGDKSCTTETVNGFSNPSFETGDLTGWDALMANDQPTDGIVAAGDATDGSYYYTIGSTTTYTYMAQTITDLDTTQSYTLSVDYRISSLTGSPSAQSYCYLGWAKDSWASFLNRQTIVPTGGDATWNSYTYLFTPTSSNHKIYFVWGCVWPNAKLDFDNLIMPLGETTTCVTDTPTSAPTSTP